MPIEVEAHSSRDISFKYHVSPEQPGIESLPKEMTCEIVLEDQAERPHKSRFVAVHEQSPRFSVSRRAANESASRS